jgi:hypothetical protein
MAKSDTPHVEGENNETNDCEMARVIRVGKKLFVKRKALLNMYSFL